MNNLKELFEIQGGLDSEINKKHPIQDGEDRLEKKHTALLVELGEMMNEWRKFKFWSTDQEPRTRVYTGEYIVLADGTEVEEYKDKLLGELVDCLHFVLSIGIELDFVEIALSQEVKPWQFKNDTLEYSFIQLIQFGWSYEYYTEGLCLFLGFCEKLGYTWEQVTEAYLIKNQENHYRQMNGY